MAVGLEFHRGILLPGYHHLTAWVILRGGRPHVQINPGMTQVNCTGLYHDKLCFMIFDNNLRDNVH